MTRLTPLLLLSLFVLAGCEPQAQQENANSNASVANDPTPESSANETRHAVCELVPIGDSGVSGTIHFTRENSQVQVRGEIHGLSPGKHGFHVHEHGDLSDKETGKSAGDHFNPTDQPHGRPTDSSRHVGDLGNIEANEDGTAQVHMDDDVIQLDGPHSVVGRALVVHAQEDAFAQPSGDAGDRVAFGVIEVAD